MNAAQPNLRVPSSRSRRLILFFIFLAALSSLFLLEQATCGEYARQPISSPYDYPVSRHVRFSYEIFNTTGLLIPEADFWCYVPVKQTGTQFCEEITASIPVEILSDDLDNQILYAKIPALPPYGRMRLHVRADLRISHVPNAAAHPDMARFLLSEPFIETTDPAIQKAAATLRGKTPRETVDRTFECVSGRIHYAGYLSKERGAAYALREKKGDCTEFAYLFAALCRANGIPARCMAGMVCPADGILRAGAYHNWAEFFEDGAWRLADPQSRRIRTRPGDYVAMRILGNVVSPMGDSHRFRISDPRLEVRFGK